VVGHSAHAQTVTPKPCDIYGNAGTACVAAHSTTRALYAAYNGPLYQVARLSDGTVRLIGVLATGGYANAALQDQFCTHTICIITRIYDQSPLHNDLTVAGPGGNGKADVGARADTLPVVAGGHQVYGLLSYTGVGYRNNNTVGVARNGQPEGMYMVASGTHMNGQCCFDYGNAELNSNDNGNGHMDAVNLSTECWFNKCYGTGPWVSADMENGLFNSDQGISQNTANTGNATPFVTALLKNNGQNYMAIKAGDATQGLLTTTFSGGEPVNNGGGYSPMKQEGAIILGIGGDNSNNGIGSFFEGVMTAGLPSDAADNAVQANIVSVGYGGPTGLAGTLTTNAEVSLQSRTPCCGNYFISHQGSASNSTVIAPVKTTDPIERADATWVIRPGLAQQFCLSFESRNRPGEYLRHYDYQLMRDPYDGSALFEKDATFCPLSGNDGAGMSFLSFNYPTRYIRNYNYNVYIASNGGPKAFDATILFPDDSSWNVTAPLSP
jgi:hypothetical protein